MKKQNEVKWTQEEINESKKKSDKLSERLGISPDCTSQQPEKNKDVLCTFGKALRKECPKYSPSAYYYCKGVCIHSTIGGLCTAPQPTDEEIREAFENTDLLKEGVVDSALAFGDNYFHKTEALFFYLGYKAQSAKLKEQAEEIEELQEENNALSISIRKVTEERDSLSSLLSEAFEEILYCETISHEVNCIVLDAKEKLEQFTDMF